MADLTRRWIQGHVTGWGIIDLSPLCDTHIHDLLDSITFDISDLPAWLGTTGLILCCFGFIDATMQEGFFLSSHVYSFVYGRYPISRIYISLPTIKIHLLCVCFSFIAAELQVVFSFLLYLQWQVNWFFPLSQRLIARWDEIVIRLDARLDSDCQRRSPWCVVRLTLILKRNQFQSLWWVSSSSCLINLGWSTNTGINITRGNSMVYGKQYAPVQWTSHCQLVIWRGYYLVTEREWGWGG